MSDLRTRIVAVLGEALPKSASDVGFYQRLGATPLVDIEAYDLNLELLADALIREIDLVELTLIDEWGIRERGEPEPGIISVDKSDLTEWIRDGDVLMHRYVTEWTSNG